MGGMDQGQGLSIQSLAAGSLVSAWIALIHRFLWTKMTGLRESYFHNRSIVLSDSQNPERKQLERANQSNDELRISPFTGSTSLWWH
jgi:hypothetical protein